jgi:Predicted heme/steroid binding protein
MYNQPFTPDKMQILEDVNVTIDLLYITQCMANKNALLNRLRRQLAIMTSVPYSGYNRNAIPADQAAEYIAPAQGPQGLPQGMQQGMPQLPQRMPQGAAPQTTDEIPPRAPQQMIHEMRENIPPYIPQTMQQGMQMPPSGSMQGMQMPPSRSTQQGMQTPPGRMQQGMTGTGGGQPGTGSTQKAPAQQPRPGTEELKSFTIDDLSRYDGKGNNPAYVAVNGMVYDVTNQPGWAAGSHFGLRAGLDQTGAYISCHTGQPMIDRLKVVGRLVK